MADEKNGAGTLDRLHGLAKDAGLGGGTVLKGAGAAEPARAASSGKAKLAGQDPAQAIPNWNQSSPESLIGPVKATHPEDDPEARDAIGEEAEFFPTVRKVAMEWWRSRGEPGFAPEQKWAKADSEGESVDDFVSRSADDWLDLPGAEKAEAAVGGGADWIDWLIATIRNELAVQGHGTVV